MARKEKPAGAQGQGDVTSPPTPTSWPESECQGAQPDREPGTGEGEGRQAGGGAEPGRVERGREPG